MTPAFRYGRGDVDGAGGGTGAGTGTGIDSLTLFAGERPG